MASDTPDLAASTPRPHDDDCFAGGGEMGARMRAADWSSTPLGPPSTWPQGLRSALSICLGSRFPIALYWGPDLTLVYNDDWSPILGVKHPWALGRSAREVWPEIWETIGPLFEHVMQVGEGTYSEDALLPMHRHGYVEECYFNFTFSPVRGAGGVDGVFNAVVETTYRVISERRNRLLRDLADRMTPARSAADACALAASSLSGATRDVPFSALYLVTRDDDSRAELAAASALPGDVAPAASVWPLDEVRASGQVTVVGDLPSRLGAAPPGGAWPEPSPAAFVAPLVAAGKTWGFLVLGANPRRAIDDEYRQFVERAAALIGGVVANANAYEAERRRAEELAAIDRAKTTFFSNVSHEFRTPLTLILGPLEDALAAPGRALAGESLDAVHRNTLRLFKLVNTLLDFSRIEAGRTQARYEPTDLSVLTQDLASAFRAAVEGGGVRYEVTAEALPQPVYVDRTMWEKIVLNLISNAFKFTFDGRIAVSLAPVGGDVELRVSDTGCGIPTAEQPRVFERFHRVEGARGRTHEGSGIGLALVKDLVTLHGGQIAVESEVGRGSTFIVRVPFGREHLPAARVLADANTAAPSALGTAPYVEEALRWLPERPDGQPAPAAPLVPGEGGRVLVADDNADMRDYLTRLLEPGWDVRTAPDGVHALELARTWRPDIILTDVMMPALDGFGLLRAVRADAALARTPVVMLSARAGEESRVEGLEAGADDYLVKPFSAQELVARVRVHIELARLRRAVESERDRLLSLLKQVPAIVNFLRGPDLIFEFVHPLALEVLGGRDVIGKPVEEAVPEFKSQEYPALLRRVIETGQPLQGNDKRVLHDDGKGGLRESFWNFIYVPVRDETGHVEGVMTFDIEVTKELRAREQLAKAMEDLEQASRAKDEFLAMLGHELRNPLSPILTALQLMKMRGGNSREQAVIERQVGHMVRLVDDLLDVARITRGKIELRRERLEIAAAVASGLEMARPLLEQRRQHLEVDVPRDGLCVDGDINRLGQVISNLLSNAAKYSDPETTIRLSAIREGDQITLTVRDQGVGIPAETLGQVFDLFYQQPQALDRAKGGLGLGLAIVKSLVELHGGHVTARSDGPGRGSAFSIQLPAARSKEIGARAAGHAAAPNEAAQPADHAVRVLIVDDNVDAADSIAELLQEMGHDVRAVNDPLTALKVAPTFRPELCLLDIGLPVMDGYELAGKLRASDALAPGGRIVALTGYGQDADRRRASEAGFDAHLVKPVTLDVLVDTLSAR
jgi:signal transduction histidine kinase